MLAKALQSLLASVERLYSSSQSRGQGVLSGFSMQLAVCRGECITNSLPSLSLLFVPNASPHSTSYILMRSLGILPCARVETDALSSPSITALRTASNYDCFDCCLRS